MGFLSNTSKHGAGRPQNRSLSKVFDKLESFISLGINPNYVRFVSPNFGSASGDGRTWDTAFSTITAGVTFLNANSGKNAAIFLDEGYYLEENMELTASDCFIIATNDAPGATVLFGTGTAGAVAAATDHTIEISGSNNHIHGLGLYCHKDTMSAVYIETDTGNSTTGDFNVFTKCMFTREAANGQEFAVEIVGANYNRFYDCYFSASSKTAAVQILPSSSNNPAYNEFHRCTFVGMDIGINVDATATVYSLLIKDCNFIEGSASGDAMTNGVKTNTGAGGDEVIINSYFTLGAASAIKDDASIVVSLDNTTT